MSKILIIETSLRKRSNSDRLAQEFARGAVQAGHQVKEISLKDKTIAFCKGCFACAELGHCVIDDDAIEIAKQMYEADTICFSTPIYYYEMSGQMKTLLDRCNSLYNSDYKFKSVYMLSTAAENEPSTDQRAVNGLCGWIDCYPKAKLCGTLFAGGVNLEGEIAGHSSLAEAYLMGKNLK